jgi:hypothetical protein
VAYIPTICCASLILLLHLLNHWLHT